MGKLNKQEIHYLHLSGQEEGKRDGKRKKASVLLYQPGLREEPAHCQSGPETCHGQAEWMSARKVGENSPLVLQ